MLDWLLATLAWLGSEAGEQTRAWITTIVGTGAASVALATYVRNQRLKREEQARLVYSRVATVEEYTEGGGFVWRPDIKRRDAAPGALRLVAPNEPEYEVRMPVARVQVAVHNKSEELVADVTVGLQGSVAGGDLRITLDVVEPGQSAVCDFLVPRPTPFWSFRSTVSFRDATGRTWYRYDADPVRQVRPDSEELAAHNRDRLGRRVPPQDDLTRVGAHRKPRRSG